jgi:DNA-binding GntR family transcriptional regulator
MPLPSEVHLQQEYGVSRDSIRRAVSYLADAGLVRTVPGRGTYVRGLTPTIVAMEPGLRIRTRPGSREECELLEAEPGSWVLVVEHRDGELEILPGDAEIRVPG